MGWSKNTPNIATMTKVKDGKNLKEDTTLLCTHCGSSDVSKIMIDGEYKQGYTSVSSFDLY
jgi:major membrane immunogen (membrane-anchored lipoprotein)